MLEALQSSMPILLRNSYARNDQDLTHFGHKFHMRSLRPQSISLTCTHAHFGLILALFLFLLLLLLVVVPLISDSSRCPLFPGLTLLISYTAHAFTMYHLRSGGRAGVLHLPVSGTDILSRTRGARHHTRDGYAGMAPCE